MPKYCYTALDKQAHRRQGTLRTADLLAAQMALEKKGWHIIDLYLKPSTLSNKPLTLAQQASLAHQWAYLLDGGLPLLTSIENLLKESHPYSPVYSILNEIPKRLNRGESLAEAFYLKKALLGDIFFTTIIAGESAGNLPKALHHFAEWAEKAAHFKEQLQSALVYPALIITVGITVFLGLMLGAVPTFESVLHNLIPLGTPLSLSTRVLIEVSQALHSAFLWIILLFILTSLLAVAVLPHPRLKVIRLRLLRKLPCIASCLEKSEQAHLFTLLGFLMKCGLSFYKTLEIARRLFGPGRSRDLVVHVYEGLRHGLCARTLLTQQPLIQANHIGMIEGGLASGQLAKIFLHLGQEAQLQFEIISKKYIKLIEPCFILVLAFFIGLLIWAFLIPILTLMNNLNI